MCIFHFHQLVITAQDMGTPPCNSTNSATLTVRVVKNNYAPEFLNQPYEGNLTIQTQANRRVFSVRVRDRDTVVREIEIILYSCPYKVVL